LSAAPGGGARLVLDPEGPPVFGVPVQAPITLALGPEGGLEETEKAELQNAGFIPISLGPGILPETAGVGVAIARALLHQNGANDVG
jgi:16S rRNA (uracil1498-N3)-methyltransferase